MRLVGPRGEIAGDVRWATTAAARLRGLRGWASITQEQALILRPCWQVHTFGLGFPIDAIFCDGDLQVLHVSTLRPRRVSRWVRGARLCVELAGGRAGRCGVNRGSRLALVEDAA